MRALAAFVLAGIAGAQEADVLAGLRAEHPRLILTEERLAELQAMRPGDALLEKAIEDVLTRADKALGEPKLEHKLVGPRLLHVSRSCLDRVYALGLAYRLTGEARYADGVRANLLTVCAFPDWNPSHFLDTAEMSHAVGIGYDWCFGAFDEETRATIRAGLIEKGLDPGLERYEAQRPAWWTTSAFNWNQVCNGGLLCGALAIADEEPDRARRIVAAAVKSLPRALATYEPDGAWGEGPAYWGYATRYTVYGLAAMTTTLGHDFGLSDRRGLEQAGYFPLVGTGPTGMYACIADAGENARRGALPVLFWLADRYGLVELAAAERDYVREQRARPQHVIWFQPEAVNAPEIDRTRLFRGPVEIAFLESGSTWVAFKAGYNEVNHGHLDLGSFELEHGGVRWIRDLGKDDYNLPGYWDKREGGKRWSYYRLGSHSHNVVTLDGLHQAVAAKSSFERFEEGGWTQAIVEIDGAFPGRVNRQRRGIQFQNLDGVVLLVDELELERACDFAWGVTTDADLVVDGATAKFLRRVPAEGEQYSVDALVAQLMSPGLSFSVESAEREPPERENKGVNRLMVRGRAGPGKLSIAVRFSERLIDGGRVPPLDEW